MTFSFLGGTDTYDLCHASLDAMGIDVSLNAAATEEI